VCEAESEAGVGLFPIIQIESNPSVSLMIFAMAFLRVFSAKSAGLS
jgi:hypothetical protein